MSSMKAKIAKLFGSTILKSAIVESAEDVGGFRRLLLRSELPAPAAGTKVQLLLPSDDMRTYSPIPTPDGVVLLGWTQAGGPGARWMSEVKAGEGIRFVGPQRSLELPAGPVILVGDETSLAVASAFEAERPGQVQAVFQAGAVEDVESAAAATGLRPFAVVPRDGTDGVVDAVLAAQAAAPQATVALTGGAELIVAVRAALRARGVRDIKTKSYWIRGRAGLD